MKKIYTLVLCLLVSAFSWGQIISPNSNIFPNTGNVGIGTISPTSALHIKKGTFFNANGDVFVDGGKIRVGTTTEYPTDGEYRTKILSDGSIHIQTTNYPFLMIEDKKQQGSTFTIGIAILNTNYSNISKSGDIILKTEQFGKSFIFGNETKNINNNFKFTTTAPNENVATTKFFIGNNGNVGIGTEIPDAKLAVNGDVHAKEVRIDLSGWPDYVFEDNYALPTIDEVEQHIQQNGHLINIPSAQEIESGGLNVSEIIKKQQEKIEELTLYIIELNKKVEKIEASVNPK